MNHCSHYFSLLISALLFGFMPVSSPAPSARVIPIFEVRSMPLGTMVAVIGTITTPSGTFESSFSDKGFGLQDKTSGIYVSLQTDLGAAIGRQAQVTGTLQERLGLLILVPAHPSDVKLQGRGPRVQPSLLTTRGVGEVTEGRLVRVVATITQAPNSDLPYGYKFFVNDGSGELQIFINTQAGIDLGGLGVGKKVSVTGFSSQFKDHYEIDPRGQADIVILPE